MPIAHRRVHFWGMTTLRSRSQMRIRLRRAPCWVQIFMQQPRLARVNIREAIRPASSDT